MKFLSLNHITQSAQAVVHRFPFAVASTIIGTLTALSFIQFEDIIVHDELFLNLIMTTVLGLPLFAAIELFIERMRLPRERGIVLQLLALAFLVAYYLLLPQDFDYESAEFIIRFVLLGISFTLAATFSPFIMHRDEANGFWQHNKTLFIRLFFTFVYSLVLFLGLCLALVSIDVLLGVNIEGETYGKLFIFIVGFVSVPFFLAGFPEKLDALEKAKDYPKGIRIFSQYILLPLLAIYAVILYIYTGKIVVAWDWPEGMVSYLIITFALGGMITYLLLFPMMSAPKKSSPVPAWIRAFSRGIYILILPMTVVFFLALKLRIDTYGLTEMRYYGVILCFWFAAMSLYFLFSRKRNVMILSVTLFGIVLLSSFGPWGAIDVAHDSQLDRLKTALIRNQLLLEGHAQEVGDQEISQEDLTIISSTLDYLYRFHGFESIQPWFREDLSELRKKGDCYGGQCVMNILGIGYINEWERRQAEEDYEGPFYYTMEGNQVVPVEGYSYMTRFYLGGNQVHSFSIEDAQYSVTLRGNTIFLQGPEGKEAQVVDIAPLLSELEAGAPKSAIQYLPSVEANGFKVLMLNIGFTGKTDEDRAITHMEGYLLLP